MVALQSVEVEANVTADRMGISPRGETEPLEALTDPVELSTPKRRPSWKMRWKRKSKSVTSSKDGSTAPEVAASEARMKAEHRASLGEYQVTHCDALPPQQSLTEFDSFERIRSKYRVATTRWPRTLFPSPRDQALNFEFVA